MRNLLALLVLLNAPFALGVMAWGLILIYHAAGLALFFICCGSLITAALGVATLLEKHQHHQHPLAHDQ